MYPSIPNQATSVVCTSMSTSGNLDLELISLVPLFLPLSLPFLEGLSSWSFVLGQKLRSGRKGKSKKEAWALLRYSFWGWCQCWVWHWCYRVVWQWKPPPGLIDFLWTTIWRDLTNHPWRPFRLVFTFHVSSFKFQHQKEKQLLHFVGLSISEPGWRFDRLCSCIASTGFWSSVS